MRGSLRDVQPGIRHRLWRRPDSGVRGALLQLCVSLCVLLLFRETEGLPFCMVPGRELPSACGAAGCVHHVQGVADIAVRPGRRILTEAGADLCLCFDAIRVRSGVVRCRLPVRTQLVMGNAECLLARGAFRITMREDLASVLVVEGVVADATTLHPRGNALESASGAAWQRVAWPRWTGQEDADVMRWPAHIEARAMHVRAGEWMSSERWLIARMLQRVREFAPLTRSAVLALALERGSLGLRVATLALLDDAECCWLLHLITPLTLSPDAMLQEQALAAWHRGSPRGGRDPESGSADETSWQGEWSPRDAARARQRSRRLDAPWSNAPEERLRAEEALERGEGLPWAPLQGVAFPRDRCLTDSAVRSLVARHAGLLASAACEQGRASPGLLLHRREAAECARTRGSQILLDGVPRHWSTFGAASCFSHAHWIPMGGDLFP